MGFCEEELKEEEGSVEIEKNLTLAKKAILWNLLNIVGRYIERKGWMEVVIPQ